MPRKGYITPKNNVFTPVVFSYLRRSTVILIGQIMFLKKKIKKKVSNNGTVAVSGRLDWKELFAKLPKYKTVKST